MSSDEAKSSSGTELNRQQEVGLRGSDSLRDSRMEKRPGQEPIVYRGPNSRDFLFFPPTECLCSCFATCCSVLDGAKPELMSVRHFLSQSKRQFGFIHAPINRMSGGISPADVSFHSLLLSPGCGSVFRFFSFFFVVPGSVCHVLGGVKRFLPLYMTGCSFGWTSRHLRIKLDGPHVSQHSHTHTHTCLSHASFNVISQCSALIQSY